MDHEVKVEIDMRMREEMGLAWKDFFEKNPGDKKEDVWRRVEERLRSKQNGEIAALAKSILSEEGVRADGSMKAFDLGRRGENVSLIRKRRIWWESVPGACSYIVYVSGDRAIFEPDHFLWETTPGIISKQIIGKTEVILPDDWPEFPKEPGTYYIGITSKDVVGNQSDPFIVSGSFKFLAPPAPSQGGIESL